jgi:glycosyltransferase involved in cell wall biosynthesis
MKVSVILCTYNRSQSLARALESVAASQMPETVDWEIVVVDNNSTDNTRPVVMEFCLRHSDRIRYLFEAQQGLSNARNAGIREARGEIIAFMDDDLTVEPTWLRNLTASLQNGTWVGAGGRVCPPKDFVQPDWLTLDGGIMDSSGVLALFDAGAGTCKLERPPFGANMAFRKSMFEKYGGFRTDLGRCGDSLIGNEDTEFGSRLLAADECLLYEPKAVVYHPVTKERLSKKYFLAWWFAYGRAMLRQKGAGPPVWGIPRVFFSIFSRAIRWLSSSPLNSKRRFYWKCRLWVAVGELFEMFGSRNQSRIPRQPETLLDGKSKY